jgi:type III restriction enzyme
MPITYKGGNYNPDFVVEALGDKFFLVEVKASDEITDEDVRAKAKAGVAWCRAMSKAIGKVWEYKLVPHDAVKSTLSFRGIISNAVSISE